MLDRLVIGTANWGREYNGHCVDETQQQLIMEYMKEVGIEWLDVATAYGTGHIGIRQFNRIYKSNKPSFFVHGQDILLAHNSHEYKSGIHDGISFDDICVAKGCTLKNAEFPYSILNRQPNQLMAILQQIPRGGSVIARSIFCKGKALKYFSPRECIDFVLMNQRIDKVILGVDSVDQLRDNVAHLVKMEKFEHNEEVDTRKF